MKNPYVVDMSNEVALMIWGAKKYGNVNQLPKNLDRRTFTNHQEIITRKAP